MPNKNKTIITAVKTSPESVQNLKQDKSYPENIRHKLWDEKDPRNEYVNYAYNKGGLDFVALLEAENGIWNIDRRSMIIGANGYYDYGFCQINKGYHPRIVNDERFFTDWKWQIDRCYDLYIGGTKFYGKSLVWKTRERFIESI